MTKVSIRPFAPADGDAMLDLQVRYAREYPGAQVVPPVVYSGPGFDEGRNVICACDEGGALRGYAALYTGAVAEATDGNPLVWWAVVKADTSLPEALSVRATLLRQLLSRAADLRQGRPGPVELRLDHLRAEQPAVVFALENGFVHVASAFHMARDLAAPIEAGATPDRVVVRQWKMTTEAEQQGYLSARNACFPGDPWDLQTLRFLLESPLWQEGASITAFVGEAVVGSVLAYWDADENARSGRNAGYTEDVFVVPAWQRRGIARHLLGEALLYLRGLGRDTALLQVRATNDGALGLHRSLGYAVKSETWHLARTLL